MKNIFRLLVVLFVLIIGFSSCQKIDEINYYEKPMEVNNPPAKLTGNKYQAYVNIEDLDNADYVANIIQTYESYYFDENGQKVINKNNYETLIYKIRVRHYWGWESGIQYISTGYVDAQMDQNVFEQIRTKLKNTKYVIVGKYLIQNGKQYTNAEYQLTGF